MSDSSPVRVEEVDGERVVGHKTIGDGQGGHHHEPLTKREADDIWAACEAAREKRAADMPDETAALRSLFEAYQRLNELGWRDAIYCPKDGTLFKAIEAGSTGVHDCHYSGKWPEGHWWILAEGDAWPSRPILFKADLASLTEAQARQRQTPNSNSSRTGE